MKDTRAEEIKEAVRTRYAGLVRQGATGCCSGSTGTLKKAESSTSGKTTSGSSCCPSDALDGKLAACGGYGNEELAAIPQGALDNSLGCGNPLSMAEVQEGQTVLDIGSGAGIDCFIAARKVGSSGRVIGIDMTDEMLERARQNAATGAYDNVEFRKGEAESMPVPDASVDWVISNCVINLSPDKPAVFAEIARVLRPGGRFSISDIVTAANLPPEVVSDLSAWAQCIAGAIPESEYLEGLRRAGLHEVEVVQRIVYDSGTLEGFLGASGEAIASTVQRDAPGGVGGRIWSARITGRK